MTYHAGRWHDVAYLVGQPVKSGINLIKAEGSFLDNEMEGLINLKKVFILTLIIFALFCAGGAGTYKIINNAKKYNEKQDLQKVHLKRLKTSRRLNRLLRFNYVNKNKLIELQK